MTKSELLAHAPPLYRLGLSVKERRRSRSGHHNRFKHGLLRDTAAAHGLRVLVETGTYMGETAWELRREFDRIETIEAEPTLARLAQVRFRRTGNVHVHAGNSAVVLPGILAMLVEPSLFWLDAHPCTDRAAKDVPVPLLAELGAIAAHPVPGHVVLIDDLRLMGRDGFPPEEQLVLTGYRFERIGDIGRLTPQNSRS